MDNTYGDNLGTNKGKGCLGHDRPPEMYVNDDSNTGARENYTIPKIGLSRHQCLHIVRMDQGVSNT